MPLSISEPLRACLERENPRVYLHPEVLAPDVQKVLRRANDQFFTLVGSGGPLVSVTPSASLAASPGGGIQLASVDLDLAAFLAVSGNAALNPENPQRRLKGMAFVPEPGFRATLRRFEAVVSRGRLGIVPYRSRFELQIYRVIAQRGTLTTGTVTAPRTEYTFAPLLSPAVVVEDSAVAWSGSDVGTARFDLTNAGLVLEGRLPDVNPGAAATQYLGYYFVVRAIDARQNDTFAWLRDPTTSRAIAGVGNFSRRWWGRDSDAAQWAETVFADAYACRFVIEQPVATAQAVYGIDLGRTPTAGAQGRVHFERSVPAGTTATLELSTAGSGGPWTTVTHEQLLAVAQQSYHLRLTLTANAARRSTPVVSALGIRFDTVHELKAEAIVSPCGIEASAPWLEAAIGEGKLTALRLGRRDFEDLATVLGSTTAPPQLEVRTYLASDHPAVTRADWLLLDRAQVSNRTPTETSEVFTLLSLGARLKRKFPRRVETINTVHTVASVGTGGVSVTVNGGTPLTGTTGGGNEYDGKRYYLRVRTATNTALVGKTAPIAGNTGTTQLDFSPAEPTLAGLVAGDTIEVHSGIFNVQKRTWRDADPADVWWELHTVDAELPPERVGFGGLGRNGRSGLPPRVTDICPGDAAGQARRRVTFEIAEQETVDEAIDQLSFLLGGTTVVVGGQSVFRQIYPLRDANGVITVAPEPVAAVFDPRDVLNPSLPPGLESRAALVSCTYGVDRTAASPDTFPESTTTWADADAIAWLTQGDLDQRGVAEVEAEIARWCYNSADAGLLLASSAARQVVDTASTGLRVWPIGLREARYDLIPGDGVVLITDRYTDYDPATATPLKGWLALRGVLLGISPDRRTATVLVPGLTGNAQLLGGQPGVLDAPSADGALAAPAITEESGSHTLTNWAYSYAATSNLAGALIKVQRRVGTSLPLAGGWTDVTSSFASSQSGASTLARASATQYVEFRCLADTGATSSVVLREIPATAPTMSSAVLSIPTRGTGCFAADRGQYGIVLTLSGPLAVGWTLEVIADATGAVTHTFAGDGSTTVFGATQSGFDIPGYGTGALTVTHSAAWRLKDPSGVVQRSGSATLSALDWAGACPV